MLERRSKPTSKVSKNATAAIALDTETTGIDLGHGCKPFLVTICPDLDGSLYWEWDVDPLTRQPQVIPEHLEEINKLISGKTLVFHNAKFDVRALSKIDALSRIEDYERVLETCQDTLLAKHALHSMRPHDLGACALRYLGLDIDQYEDRLQKAVNKARAIARRDYPDWRIAKKGDPLLPSAKNKLWKFDLWLPRAIAKAAGYSEDHEWWTILADYASSDSYITYRLWHAMEKELKERDLYGIYRERCKLLAVTYAMEERGITYHSGRLEQLAHQYAQEAKENERVCVRLSKGRMKELPLSGSSNALRETLFDYFKLKPLKRSKKTGAPSVDKDVLEHWSATLPSNKPAAVFVNNLSAFRKRMTGISYMKGYQRSSLPWSKRAPDWRLLLPGLNITGTDTLRNSSSNPNEQNISKKEGFNLRYLFGPTPGREWWSIDYSNIELRIPAYEAGETEMIMLFERPDESPYYGSHHLLTAHVLHPKMFEECLKNEESFKDKYKATWYQWVKNGNFAVQYGAIEKSGTADRAYHVPGAQARIQARFSNIAELNQRMISYAQEHGFVETMPDAEFGQGYPLVCPFDERGRVQPTVPLNYHVQGTAMWCTSRAMVRCYAYLRRLNASLPVHRWYYLIMQIHDEMVFDFPAAPKSFKGEPWEYNLPKIRMIKRLMEQSGKDIGVPLTVGVTYHSDNWAEGKDIEFSQAV